MHSERQECVGLGNETPHQPVSNFVDNSGVFSATKYKSTFQTDLEKRKFIIQSFELDQNVIQNNDAELKEAVIKLFLDTFEVLALCFQTSLRFSHHLLFNKYLSKSFRVQELLKMIL